MCVYVCVLPLHAVRPPGNFPGPYSSNPPVSGSHGDMASISHHNLQVPSERSSGANDRVETVTMQTPVFI